MSWIARQLGDMCPAGQTGEAETPERDTHTDEITQGYTARDTVVLTTHEDTVRRDPPSYTQTHIPTHTPHCTQMK